MHRSNRLLLLLLLVLGSKLTQGAGDCNACGVDYNQACVSEDEFQTCVSGSPVGQIYKCSNGMKCTLKGTCQEVDSDTLIPCKICNICDSSGTFACTGTRTFALCLGTGEKSDITGTCAPNNVCSLNNKFICAPETSYPPTCSYTFDPTTAAPTTTTTTTTPSPSADPQGYCSTMGVEGRFPVGTNKDTTCKQYIHCIRNNGEWIGALYYCPGGNYFHSQTAACNGTLPARCGGTVSSLALFDLELN